MKGFCSENISSQNLMKYSAQKNLRATILKDYPKLENVIDSILPKKGGLILGKCINHVSILIYKKELLFFQMRNGPWIPSLKLVHKYPFMVPQIQVDKGAIKHVLRGSNIMCPGVTSPGGKIVEELKSNTVIQVRAEGKQYACAIGITTMSTQDILEKNRDTCIENIHYLNDGLWNFQVEN